MIQAKLRNEWEIDTDKQISKLYAVEVPIQQSAQVKERKDKKTQLAKALTQQKNK